MQLCFLFKGAELLVFFVFAQVVESVCVLCSWCYAGCSAALLELLKIGIIFAKGFICF